MSKHNTTSTTPLHDSSQHQGRTRRRGRLISRFLITQAFAAVLLTLGCGGSYDPVTFEVDGSDAIMRGVIDARTVDAVEALLRDHPGVTRIVMQDVPGSADDTSNLQASRMIREAGLSTWVPGDGEIASGGVDFFCAGVERGADVAGGARFGVHSWGGFGVSGAKLERDHSDHDPYLEYYEEMGIPASFYWFTLEAASPKDIHWMSAEEIDRYELLTP